MRKTDIDKDLSQLAFDFFYWLSRFEFLLKRNSFLKSERPGDKAEPSWKKFVDSHASGFAPSEASRLILRLSPKRQIVGAAGELEWKPIGLNDCRSELERVVRLLCTIRNNLFHGGKSGVDDWDDPKRMKCLLTAGIEVLDDLAVLSGYESDYSRYY